MRFLKLHARSFRNYREARLEPGPGLNLLVGENASGKTNLLEALAVVGSGRSPRLRGAELLVQRGAQTATLEAAYQDARGDTHKVSVGLDRSGRRRIHLDAKPTRRLSELLGRLPVVQLFPEDLAMPVGPPGLRRAFLDMVAAALVPGFLAVRQAEERALRQRNAALKAHRPSRELAALDPPFLDRAAEVLEARARGLAAVREAIEQLPRLYADEALELDYWALGRDRAMLRVTLEERLRATAPEERRLRVTRVGPHRDDFRIRLGGLPVPGNASRGQLRSLMLRLKLAEARAVEAARGHPPVLLLDDALSDMDATRRERTLEHLTASPGQVFLTVPEAPPGGDPAARRFRVRHGTVTQA